MSEHLSCEAVVIGAGVVGLAIARALAMAGREVVILERNLLIGSETSARNSEVIHAGIYYPQGSLKAKMCVEGRHRLYAFAASHGVPHKRLGKYLVATDAGQEAKLAAIQVVALANGVTDIASIAAATVRAQEPELRFSEVLESPSTGIINSHAYMLALLGEAQDYGANIVFQTDVRRMSPVGDGWRLLVRNGAEDITLDCSVAINSAGLWAQGIARATDGLSLAFVPPLYLAKGCYAALTGKTPFRRLIYPMPETGGLGVHLTMDLAGQGRFGPDVEWLDDNDPAHIDYAVPANIGRIFAERIRGWWPTVDAARLSPAYSGVRPKYTSRTEAAGDFRVDGPAVHGLPGLVNLFGIESPGLTSSLAMADHVAGLLA